MTIYLLKCDSLSKLGGTGLYQMGVDFGEDIAGFSGRVIEIIVEILHFYEYVYILTSASHLSIQISTLS